MNLFAGKKRFILIGHSFGAVLAIKLAKILEQNGLTGEVICADGAVSMFKQCLQSNIPQHETQDETVQRFIWAQFVFELLPDMGLDEIQKILTEKTTFEDRADTFIGLVPKSEYSKPYLKDFGYGLANRMKMILNESEECTDGRISSNITLVRPTTHLVADIPNDYNLKQFTNGQITVSFVEGNHLTMLDNSELYQIVNNICIKKAQT